MSTSWRKRIVLWVTVLIVMYVLMVILNATYSDAHAATLPGAGKCKVVDTQFRFEEGSIGLDIGKVDVTGVLCSRRDGMFNSARTTINMDASPTTQGALTGWHFWNRGPTYKTEENPSFQSFVALVSYKACGLGQLSWWCSPTGHFRVHVRYADPKYQRPIQIRRWINHRDSAASEIHFAD